MLMVIANARGYDDADTNGFMTHSMLNLTCLLGLET